MARRSKISDSQLSTLISRAQRTMCDSHSDSFRRIWVQYARIGKNKVDIVITLFPLVGEYRMVFFRGLNVHTITAESVMGLIDG